jgi:hypothetical protein
MARKFLIAIDLARNELQNSTIQNLASAPSTPNKGLEYFDTTLNQFGVYNGTVWVYLSNASGSGTVTTVSLVPANGLSGTVTNPTTTPAITLSTTITGILKGNGTAISTGVSGTDYSLGTATNATGIVKSTTTTGALTTAIASDFPLLNQSTTGTAANVTGIVAIANGGTNSATQNFVDLTTAQTIAGIKTFSANPTVPTPVGSTDVANKSYVDSTAQGLNVKPSARVSTTGSETFTILAGNVTTIAGLTVDGVTLAINDRLLIKDAPLATGVGSSNSTQPGNGAYVVTANTTNLTVARTSDMSGSNTPLGAFIFVETGTVNTSAGFTVSVPNSAGTFIYGTGNIQWTQFSGAGEILAGTGITKTGNTIALTTPVTVTNGGSGAGTLTGLIKGNGTSAFTAAVSGTDYAPATATTNILKGNGSGGFTSAKFIATIGDGTSTSIAVTHSLGTQDVLAQIRDATSNAKVECDIIQTSTTVTTFTFVTAPATNAYKVVIIG